MMLENAHLVGRLVGWMVGGMVDLLVGICFVSLLVPFSVQYFRPDLATWNVPRHPSPLGVLAGEVFWVGPEL